MMTTAWWDIQDRNYKRFAWGGVITAILVAFLYGWSIATTRPLSNAFAALLIAIAALSLGGLTGFVFGIPKSLERFDTESSGEGESSASRHGWRTNTNLEQVSDWLTKILIGVGLTQLQQIPTYLQETGEFAASSLGPNASPAVITAMQIAFAIGGFITAYLLTKFDLSRAIDAQAGLLAELAHAILQNPNDRKAVEAYMMNSLYLSPPDSFKQAIQAGEAFLSQEGHPAPDDSGVFAYLACAYGQKYAFERARKADAATLEAIRDEAVGNAHNAISRAPEWRGELRQFANPPVGSTDDDLSALKDDPKLRALLFGPTTERPSTTVS